MPLFGPLPKRAGFARTGPSYAYLAWAYWQAGQTLFSTVDPQESRVVALPAAYLYRHALELVIKGILAEVGPVSESTVVKRGHRLLAHMDDLRRAAAKVSHGLPADIEDLLREIDTVDPDGARLKYPKDTKLVPYGEFEFDVNSFKETGDRLIQELVDLYEKLSAEIYAEILRNEDFTSG